MRPFSRVIELEARAARMIERGAMHDALPLLQEAAEHGPGDSRLIANLASLQRMTGNLEAAADNACRALRLDSANGLAVSLVADLCARDILFRLIPKVEHALDGGYGLDAERAALHFGCSKARHRMEDYDKAFWHASRGAALQRSNLHYNVESDIAVIDRIIATHRPPRLKAADVQPPTAPVFVCGLPRSGTTMMEQLILRSGSMRSIGERSALMDAIGHEMRARQLGGASRADAAENVTSIDASHMIRHYVESLNALAVGSHRFVDKTPMNALYVGLIAAGNGGARTVLMQKSRRDAVLGIFRTNFSGLYPFALDLDDLAKYVTAFDRLALHWENSLPPELFQCVRYERAVTQPAQLLPPLFAFMGLEWGEALMSKGEVHTIAVSASAAQVMKPINTENIDTWRYYEKQLARIEPHLED